MINCPCWMARMRVEVDAVVLGHAAVVLHATAWGVVNAGYRPVADAESRRSRAARRLIENRLTADLARVADADSQRVPVMSYALSYMTQLAMHALSVLQEACWGGLGRGEVGNCRQAGVGSVGGRGSDAKAATDGGDGDCGHEVARDGGREADVQVKMVMVRSNPLEAWLERSHVRVDAYK
jgi:hypothetical protein